MIALELEFTSFRKTSDGLSQRWNVLEHIRSFLSLSVFHRAAPTEGLILQAENIFESHSHAG